MSVEIKQAILWCGEGEAELPRAELVMRLAEFKALVGEAERGALRSEDWKPVVTHPELWELRWSWESGAEIGGTSLWRGYFHEPTERPRQTVVARVHRKDVSSGDPEVISREQNEEMRIAADRITAERDYAWGLDVTSPILGEA